MRIVVARPTMAFAAILAVLLTVLEILVQVYEIKTLQIHQRIDYSSSPKHNQANIENSPIRLWSQGDLSIVETSKYLHSYPIRPKEPINVTALRHNRISLVVFPFTVRAVYYVNTKVNSNYDTWIRNQLMDLGQVDELYIVADSRSCAEELKLHDAIAWLKTHRNESVIELECHDSPVETFEYHGINKLWELGQKHPGSDDIAIYLHSKGITHATDYDMYRKSWFEHLTRAVFSESEMDRVREAFLLFPSIDMAGMDCCGAPWVWYNFFYARGSYLKTVEQPIMSKRRHYYEDWLFRAGKDPQETAPHAPERPLESYPGHPAFSCYALSGDHVTAPNLGFYFNHLNARRYPDVGFIPHEFLKLWVEATDRKI